MDEVKKQILDNYCEALKSIEVSVPHLTDEVVWLEMYKCFVNWHAIARTPGVIYADAADQALMEFKKRFRD